MLKNRRARALLGQLACDRTGKIIGVVEQIFLDDRSRAPSFIRLRNVPGRTDRVLVPVSGATIEPERVRLDVDENSVLTAPAVSADAERIRPEFEDSVYTHFGLTRPALRRIVERGAGLRLDPVSESAEANTATLPSGNHDAADDLENHEPRAGLDAPGYLDGAVSHQRARDRSDRNESNYS